MGKPRSVCLVPIIHGVHNLSETATKRMCVRVCVLEEEEKWVGVTATGSGWASGGRDSHTHTHTHTHTRFCAGLLF